MDRFIDAQGNFSKKVISMASIKTMPRTGIAERVRGVIKNLMKTKIERIHKKYSDNKEKANKLIERAKRAFKLTELCLLAYKANRMNISDDIRDETLEAMVEQVYRLFYAVPAPYNRVYVLTGLSKDRDPNVFEVYPHWSLLYAIYKPYFKNIVMEEVRNPNTGELIFVKCKIIDKYDIIHEHSVAGADLDRYSRWPDKVTMLKKHALRHALAFTFPTVLLKFGIETYGSESPEEINQQYINPQYPTPQYGQYHQNNNMNRDNKQNNHSIVEELRSKLNNTYSALLNVAGRERARQIVTEYKASNNLPDSSMEWTIEQLKGAINTLQTELEKLQKAENQ